MLQNLLFSKVQNHEKLFSLFTLLTNPLWPKYQSKLRLSHKSFPPIDGRFPVDRNNKDGSDFSFHAKKSKEMFYFLT